MHYGKGSVSLAKLVGIHGQQWTYRLSVDNDYEGDDDDDPVYSG